MVGKRLPVAEVILETGNLLAPEQLSELVFQLPLSPTLTSKTFYHPTHFISPPAIICIGFFHSISGDDLVAARAESQSANPDKC